MLNGQLNPALRETQRAQVIALYDYIKSEMPDVFFIDPALYAAGDDALHGFLSVQLRGECHARGRRQRHAG